MTAPSQVSPQQHAIDIVVDDLLSRWHAWRNEYTHERGYRGTDATCRDAQSAYHYHDRAEGGSVERYVEDQIMRAVDRAVERIPDWPHPWHLVILFEARNAYAGAEVWSSIRLPPGEELEVLRLEARAKLYVELQREGCIGG